MRNQFEENQNAFCDLVQVTQVKPVIKRIISVLDSWNETFFERISQNETLLLHRLGLRTKNFFANDRTVVYKDVHFRVIGGNEINENTVMLTYTIQRSIKRFINSDLW